MAGKSKSGFGFKSGFSQNFKSGGFGFLIPIPIPIPAKNEIIPESIPIPESESCITDAEHGQEQLTLAGEASIVCRSWATLQGSPKAIYIHTLPSTKKPEMFIYL